MNQEEYERGAIAYLSLWMEDGKCVHKLSKILIKLGTSNNFILYKEHDYSIKQQFHSSPPAFLFPILD